jgi:hypothetical protein
MSEQNSEPRPVEPPAPPVPPVPRYGEYSSNPYGVPGVAAPAGPTGSDVAPASVPPRRTRRTWDVVLTIILLVLGFFGTLAGIGYAAIFSTPSLLDQTMRSAGFGGFSGTIGAAPTVLIASHIGLFVLAAGLSTWLLVHGRVVVFWVPLVAGFVAAIVFWVTVVSVILSDPNFVQNYSG